LGFNRVAVVFVLMALIAANRIAVAPSSSHPTQEQAIYSSIGDQSQKYATVTSTNCLNTLYLSKSITKKPTQHLPYTTQEAANNPIISIFLL
jgi:hypothetical protein